MMGHTDVYSKINSQVDKEVKAVASYGVSKTSARLTRPKSGPAGHQSSSHYASNFFTQQRESIAHAAPLPLPIPLPVHSLLGVNQSK